MLTYTDNTYFIEYPINYNNCTGWLLLSVPMLVSPKQHQFTISDFIFWVYCFQFF